MIRLTPYEQRMLDGELGAGAHHQGSSVLRLHLRAG